MTTEPTPFIKSLAGALAGATQRPDADPDKLDAFVRGVMHLTGAVDWLPSTWPVSVLTFVDRGLPISLQLELVAVAVSNPALNRNDWFRYFAGCCWTAIRARNAIAILEARATP